MNKLSQSKIFIFNSYLVIVLNNINLNTNSCIQIYHLFIHMLVTLNKNRSTQQSTTSSMLTLQNNIRTNSNTINHLNYKNPIIDPSSRSVQCQNNNNLAMKAGANVNKNSNFHLISQGAKNKNSIMHRLYNGHKLKLDNKQVNQNNMQQRFNKQNQGKSYMYRNIQNDNNGRNQSLLLDKQQDPYRQNYGINRPVQNKSNQAFFNLQELQKVHSCQYYNQNTYNLNPQLQAVCDKLDRFQDNFVIKYKPISKQNEQNYQSNGKSHKIYRSLIKQLQELSNTNSQALDNYKHGQVPTANKMLSNNFPQTAELKQTAHFKYIGTNESKRQIKTKGQSQILRQSEGLNQKANYLESQYFKNKINRIQDVEQCYSSRNMNNKNNYTHQNKENKQINNLSSQRNQVLDDVNSKELKQQERGIRYCGNSLKLQVGSIAYSHNHRYLRVAPRARTERSEQSQLLRKIGGIRRQNSNIDLLKNNANYDYNLANFGNINCKPLSSQHKHHNNYSRPKFDQSSSQRLQQIREQLHKIYSNQDKMLIKSSQQLKISKNKTYFESRNSKENSQNRPNLNLYLNKNVDRVSQNRWETKSKEHYIQQANKINKNNMDLITKKNTKQSHPGMIQNPKPYFVGLAFQNKKNGHHYSHRLLLQKSRLQA